jgi:hypothetical protein
MRSMSVSEQCNVQAEYGAVGAKIVPILSVERGGGVPLEDWIGRNIVRRRGSSGVASRSEKILVKEDVDITAVRVVLVASVIEETRCVIYYLKGKDHGANDRIA